MNTNVGINKRRKMKARNNRNNLHSKCLCVCVIERHSIFICILSGRAAMIVCRAETDFLSIFNHKLVCDARNLFERMRRYRILFRLVALRIPISI